jgi:hypothetical protein
MFELYTDCKRQLDQFLCGDSDWVPWVDCDHDDLKSYQYKYKNLFKNVQISSEGEGVQLTSTLPESALTDLNIAVNNGKTFREAIVDDEAIVTMAVATGTSTISVVIYPKCHFIGHIAFEIAPQNDIVVLERIMESLIRCIRTSA